MDKKTNILFFFTDDQRFNTIAAIGNDEIITPNIDRLVKNGTVFTQAHIPSGTCGAICMPSRAMLNTGRTLFHLDGEGQTISEEHALIGETFQKAGYRTFGTGKWHNGTRAYARSFTDGGEIFFGGMDDHWNVPAHSFDPTGEYSERTIKVSNYFYDNKEQTHICNHVTPGKHSSELFCDAAIDFINSCDGSQPFYAYVSFMAPHDPRTMPLRFKEMYDPEKIKLPENFMSMHPIEYGNANNRDELLAPYPRTPENTRQQIAEYYAMITHLDYEMGRVIKVLEEKGMADDTIILFAGDNGLALGQHGLFGKQNHYEHSIRVPFIISGKGIPGNNKRDAYIYLLDIFPTICDLIGIDVPDTVEGKSFAKIIDDKDYKTRDTLYFAYKDKIRSVKDERYKLMEFVHEGKLTTQLYDLKNDPWELANLYYTEGYSHIIDKLRKEMYGLRDEWEDEKHPLGKSYWTQYRQDIESNAIK
jgi:arylsulfatase A-like enzyme